jgi:hypothetical protein
MKSRGSVAGGFTLEGRVGGEGKLEGRLMVSAICSISVAAMGAWLLLAFVTPATHSEEVDSSNEPTTVSTPSDGGLLMENGTRRTKGTESGTCPKAPPNAPSTHTGATSVTTTPPGPITKASQAGKERSEAPPEAKTPPEGSSSQAPVPEKQVSKEAVVPREAVSTAEDAIPAGKERSKAPPEAIPPPEDSLTKVAVPEEKVSKEAVVPREAAVSREDPVPAQSAPKI